MKYLKTIFLSCCFLLLFTIGSGNAKAYWVEHSGAGSTSSSGWSSYGGGFSAYVYGVRATLVDKNGDRLGFTLRDGQQLVSDSRDFFDKNGGTSLSFCQSDTLCGIDTWNFHSRCTKSNGEKTLCYKKDTAGSSMEFVNDGYYDDHWHYIQNWMPNLWIGNYIKSGFSVSGQFSKLAEEKYRGDLESLFKRLMGEPLETILKQSGGHCKENKQQLEEAYLVYEILTFMGSDYPSPFAQYDDPRYYGLVGTASEFSTYFPKTTGNPCWEWLPNLDRALYIPINPGSLGNNYFYAPPEWVPYSNCGWGFANEAADSHKGHFMGILHLTSLPEAHEHDWSCDWNYNIDAACDNDNCDAITKDGSYYIQDTNNWEAIEKSVESDLPNVKSYYKKTYGNCTLFCREEYKIKFPNKQNFVTFNNETVFNVSTGRYFTINLPGQLAENGIANFGPISIEKIRQCKTTGDASCLDNFAKNVGVGQMGTIHLDYKETKGKQYSVSKDLVADGSRTKVEKPTKSNNIITMKKTEYYVLPDNVYRYYKNGTGEPVNGNFAGNNSYQDYLTSTIPVSFNNTPSKGDRLGGNITLTYNMASNDSYSKMNKAFANPDYFQNRVGSENVYKKYIDKKITEDVDKNEIAKSSCAKLYGYSDSASSKFYKCAQSRQTDPTSECYKSITGAYVCKDYTCDYGYPVCPDGTCPDKEGICLNGDSCTNLGGNKCLVTTWSNKSGTQTKKETTFACNDDYIQNKYPGCSGSTKCRLDLATKKCIVGGKKYNCDAENNNVDSYIKTNYPTCPNTKGDCEMVKTSKTKTVKINGVTKTLPVFEHFKNGRPITEAIYDTDCTCKILSSDEFLDSKGVLIYSYKQYLKECQPCQIVTTSDGDLIYYDKNRQAVTYTEFKKQCGNCPPPGCPNPGCAPEDECPCEGDDCINGDPCIKCPSGACPMPGGVCPGTGREIIYRPIDLDNPFPGIGGSSSKSRETGTNWCEKDLTKNVLHCSASTSTTPNKGNKVVQTQITNNRKVKTYEVYKRSPLYEVTIDANAIKTIQDYNKKHPYDDWNITCKGISDCSSTFLKKIGVTGDCMKNSKTCAESKGGDA